MLYCCLIHCFRWTWTHSARTRSEISTWSVRRHCFRPRSTWYQFGIHSDTFWAIPSSIYWPYHVVGMCWRYSDQVDESIEWPPIHRQICTRIQGMHHFCSYLTKTNVNFFKTFFKKSTILRTKKADHFLLPLNVLLIYWLTILHHVLAKQH